MHIAIDIDDVTVSITQGLIDFHNSLHKTEFTIEDHSDFALHTIWNITPEEAMEEVYAFYHSPAMDGLPPMDGAISGINELRGNHKISFVTSRPQFLEVKTKKWLEKHFPGVNLPVYLTNQFTPDTHKKVTKAEICKQIKAELMIEDSPANVQDCVSEHIPVLLFERQWNKEIKDTKYITRVRNWKEILERVALIAE